MGRSPGPRGTPTSRFLESLPAPPVRRGRRRGSRSPAPQLLRVRAASTYRLQPVVISSLARKQHELDPAHNRPARHGHAFHFLILRVRNVSQLQKWPDPPRVPARVDVPQRVRIARDEAAGLKPCAVVATTGTTASTALDPIERIAATASAHGLWLHVDSAMAGSAMVLPECRWMWRGVEGADSLVMNPHKWLGVAFDCSLYYVRDPEHLVRVMSTNPSYLRSSVDAKVKNLRDWGLPLGRRFRALKLWFAIREQGVAGLQRRLRRDLANAKWLAEQVGAAEGWKLLAPVHLQTVCLRHEPAGVDGETLDRHTLDWVDRVNRSGQAYLTPAILDGRWMVRVSIGALPTEREHVEALWKLMRAEAERK